MGVEEMGVEEMDVNDSLLLPVVDEDGAPFWEYAARGELRVQACASPPVANSASRPALLPALRVVRE